MTNHIMIDIETLGISVDSAPMLSLGAVKFDPYTSWGAANINKKVWYFNPDVDGRCVDLNTVLWWTKQENNLFNKTLAEAMQQPVDAVADTLKEFDAWCGEKATLWAAPVVFDCAILRSYMDQFNVDFVNIDHRRFVDCKSYAIGKGTEFKRQQFDGMIQHDPIDDCMSQVLEIQNINANLC